MVELEKLEREVREMAKKISEYRNTLPDHLSNTLDIASGSDPMPSSSERLAIPPGFPLFPSISKKKKKSNFE